MNSENEMKGYPEQSDFQRLLLDKISGVSGRVLLGLFLQSGFIQAFVFLVQILSEGVSWQFVCGCKKRSYNIE